jgi:hypothetical protein
MSPLLFALDSSSESKLSAADSKPSSTLSGLDHCKSKMASLKYTKIYMIDPFYF